MLDLLLKRRSIRKFKAKDVGQAKIDYILKSALLSPSSKSRRPWEFVVVTDKELLAKLSQAREHGSTFLKDAPLGVVVIADPSKCDVWVEDCSIASIIMQLTAETLDLGSCWIQIRERYTTSIEETSSSDYIKSLLNIPMNYQVESIVAIGYPNEEKEPHKEEDLIYDKIHTNKYNR